MSEKISLIKRFFTLLFTDEDIKEDFSQVSSEAKEVVNNKTSEDFQEIPSNERTFREEGNQVNNLPELSKKEARKEEKEINISPKEVGPEEERIRPTVKDFFSAIPEDRLKKKIPEKRENEGGDNEKAELSLGFTSNHTENIHISSDALKRHMLIVGMTGSGKTTMMEQMILQDIEAGRGVGLIDPHGDLYEKILSQIPKNRSNDVVLFDLTDIEYPVGFNILENSHHQFPSLIASSLVGVFKKIFGYSWGPRLEYILRNATLTLLERDGSTLLDLTLLLSDEDFRTKYIAKVTNPFLRRFWADEFNTLSSSRQAEVVSPILNKVGQFLSVPLIRNIVSQPQSGFSPRWIMDNKKIFLANLSKGKIGEDVSDMLGSLLVSKFQLDVMSRANIVPEERSSFRLYVDEFQNFATESFSDIFSEARKYGLGLVIAHQYINQVPDKLMDAILGNVGNIVAFHVGSSDAKILSANMDASILPGDMIEQPLYHFFLKTTKNHKKKIFQGELGLQEFRVGQDPEKLRSLVRDKFAKKRSFVEEKLNIKVS